MRRRNLLLSASSGGIDPITGRGTIGDYEVVDLGLSNGLLFATCNVGASGETEYGDYYMYGKGSRTYQSTDSAYEGTENPLSSSLDTATKVMGEGWRMPTQAELQDLIDNITYSWTTINGIKGGKFTSKANPNAYVFFPAAGLYNDGSLNARGSEGFVWSSTPRDSRDAYGLACDDWDEYVSYGYRSNGLPVRGVHAAV